MSKTYETSHAKNIANFEALISFVIAYGAIYNPSNALITIGNMQLQLVKAKDAVNELHVLLADWSNAVAAREIGFIPLKKLGTRLLNALKATDTPIQVIENMVTLNRKLQGKRASAKLTDEEVEVLAEEGKVVNQISAAQLSYDSLLDNFDKLVKLLATIPQYNPNEMELKVVTLTSLRDMLKQLNIAVVTTGVALSNVRLLRKEVMYDAETGLVATAQLVKMYLKSVFGVGSAQFKQISGMAFRVLK